MWKGRMKALTFSYDDGTVSDRRLVEILNEYGLRSTFNLSSDLLGGEGRVLQKELCGLYEGHEVACHTLSHLDLTRLDDGEIIRQVEDDRLALSSLVGYEVCGMAYPYGRYDGRVIDLIRSNTEVRYSRGISSTYSFDVGGDPLELSPTVYHVEGERLLSLADEFLNAEPERPMLFYIWGHSYEFGQDGSGIDFALFEKFCATVSGRNEIFYGTNKEVLLL